MWGWRSLHGPAAALAAAAAVAGAAGARAGAPAWTEPQRVAEAGNSPQVGFDATGNAVAVWLDGGAVRASFRRAGGTWSAPGAVSRAGTTAESVALGVGDAGDAVVAWVSVGSPGTRAILAATRAPGRVFTSPRELARADASSSLGAPRVAVDATGRSAVVWSRSAPTAGSTIWLARGGRNRGASPPVRLGTGVNPAVAWDGRGRAIAAWVVTRAVVISASTSAAVAVSRTVSLGEDVLSGPIDLAANTRGDFVASLQTSSGAPAYRASVRALVGRIGGEIGAAEVIGDGVGYLAGSRAAIDAAGRAAVTWFQDYNTRFPLYVSRGTRAGFGAPEKIADDVGAFDLALDRRGNAVAVWSRWAGDYVVEAARAAPGAGFDDPVPLSAAGYNASGTRIDVDRDGDAIAAWGRSYGSRTFVQAAGLDAAGPQLRALRFTRRVSIGVRGRFAVAPVDVWSSVRSVNWSFGDGTTARAARVAHAYQRVGRYRVRVTATDARGHSRTAVRTVQVTRR